MNRNRLIRPIVILAAAALAVALGTTGLAVAGVNLPDPAQKAFEKAGLSLPNQAGGGENGEHVRSEGVRAVIETTPPSERGCGFGHTVAEAAKGSALPEQAQAACDHGEENSANGKAKAETNSSSSNHSQFGRDTAERAKDQKDAGVDDRKSFGEETSGQAQDLGGAPEANRGAEQRAGTPAAEGTTGAPEGTPTAPPEGTPSGPPDGTPTGPPDGTPNGAPEGPPSGRP
jgi:hypothetical protein